MMFTTWQSLHPYTTIYWHQFQYHLITYTTYAFQAFPLKILYRSSSRHACYVFRRPQPLCLSHCATTCCRTRTLKLLVQFSAFSRYFLCIRPVCTFASEFKTLISILISNFHYFTFTVIFDPFFRGPRLETCWECLSIDASPCRTYLSSSKSYRLPEEDLQILCFYLWGGIKLRLVARINEAGIFRGERLAFCRYEW
jgi:hypothetical protein